MNPLKHSIAGALTLVLAAASFPSHADWAQSIYPNYTPPLPNNLEAQSQNPPVFSWSKHSSNPPEYIVEIKDAAGVAKTYTTNRSFFFPSAKMTNGQYSWRVRPSLPLNNSDWSTSRSFVINDSATPFIVPDTTSLATTITNRVRPRQLPASFVPASQWSLAMRADRNAALTTLVSEVNARITSLPILSDSMWPLVTTTSAITAAKVAQDNDIRGQIGLLTRQLETSSLLYRLTGDVKYLNEAFTRGDQLVKLSPDGPTSYANQDQATRQIALSLIKAIDFIGTGFTSNATVLARRKAWLDMVAVRTRVMYADFSRDNFRMDQAPFDSHGSTMLGYLALISTLSLGDIPEAKTWFDGTFRAYAKSITIWAGPEGGYADGTAYGQYSVDFFLQLWQPLSQATGVDLFKKPWAQGLSRFFMHFQPPGAPGHVFGDEHDVLTQPTLMKAFASRFATPAAAWYVKSLAGTDENPLSLLQAEYPLPVATVATAVPPPNAALYPSIGWVAMHSDLSYPLRTSVYFKSSPYGSYNHSHLDQNSIVIDSGGRRLLTEAGYSDYYYSPLAQSWFRTTKAKNAITFDGGIGQPPANEGWQNLLTTGKITAFSTTSALDYAEGDATLAYGSALSSSIRKVWYLRDQNAVVVIDRLAAPQARTFEWNMHAAAPIVEGTDKIVRIDNKGATLCMRSMTPTNTGFAKRTGAPAKTGTVEDHAVFVKTAAAVKAEFIVVLDVGCRNPTVTLTNTATGRDLKIVSSTGLTRTLSIGAQP